MTLTERLKEWERNENAKALTFREHRLATDREYFKSIMSGRSSTEAIRISGMHHGSFYRQLNRLGLSKSRRTGNAAWKSLAEQKTTSRAYR